MRPHECWVLPQGQDTTLIHKYKPYPNPNLLGLQEALLALTLTSPSSGKYPNPNPPLPTHFLSRTFRDAYMK